MINKKTALITLALLIAVIPSVSAHPLQTATFFDWLVDEPSVIEDPLLCVAIDMWGCEIPPENAIYGELFTHDIFTVQVPSVDPWINVTGINQTGNFSILEQGVLDPWTIKITRNGTYMADYSVSFQAPGGASDYHFGISLNGADPENKTHSHRANTAGGDWGVSSLSAIMQLNDGDKIFLQVSDTDAPARDIEIQSANFNTHELQTFQTSQTIIVNQTTSGISGNITGVWVNKTGDTMSGSLNISSNGQFIGFGANTGNINVSGNISSSQEIFYIRPGSFGGTFGELAIQGPNVPASETWLTILKPQGNDSDYLAFHFDDAENYPIIRANSNGVAIPILFESDIYSDQDDLGAFSDSFRFGNIFLLQNIHSRGNASFTDSPVGANFVNITGEGDIDFTGNMSVKNGDTVIWANGTVEIGPVAFTGNITGVWVNKTGDTMSGDLNISAAAAITNTLRVGGHSAFGTTGALFAIRVLDAAEDINIDSSYNGIVSVLRQMVNNSGGREVLAFNYEVVCDSNITCGGNMAGYRGNSRNRGWAEIMRGGYVTVFNERADHNITNAVGLFAVISTRLNNIRGMITTADAVRSQFSVENGTIGNATGFRMIDDGDRTPSRQGTINNIWGIKIDDLMSDKHDASWTFDLGDSINWSRIRGNFTGDQWAELNYVNVTDTAHIVTTIVTDNITVVGKDTHIKGGLSFVETFPKVFPEAADSLFISTWGLGVGILGNPDVPRTVNVTFTSLDLGGCTGFLYVNGTDAFGRYITELFTVSVPGNGAAEYETDHAYGNVTAVAEDSAAGNCIYTGGTTWRIGVANYPLNVIVDIYKLNVDGAHVAEPAAGYDVIPRYGTVNLEGVAGERLSLIIWYRYGVNS